MIMADDMTEELNELTSDLNEVFNRVGRWGESFYFWLSMFAAHELNKACGGRLYACEEDPEFVNIHRRPDNKYKNVMVFATDGRYLYYKDGKKGVKKAMIESAYPTDLLSIVGFIEGGLWRQEGVDIIKGAEYD